MRRTPSMYAFYERSIITARDNGDWGEYYYLIDDAPQSIKDALVRNEIIEESVEESRKGTNNA